MGTFSLTRAGATMVAITMYTPVQAHAKQNAQQHCKEARRQQLAASQYQNIVAQHITHSGQAHDAHNETHTGAGYSNGD